MVTMVVLMFDVSADVVENGMSVIPTADTSIVSADTSIVSADTSMMSGSSLYGFCSLSRTVSARCRNAVANPNKAVVTIDSVTSEAIM